MIPLFIYHFIFFPFFCVFLFFSSSFPSLFTPLLSNSACIGGLWCVRAVPLYFFLFFFFSVVDLCPLVRSWRETGSIKPNLVTPSSHFFSQSLLIYATGPRLCVVMAASAATTTSYHQFYHFAAATYFYFYSLSLIAQQNVSAASQEGFPFLVGTSLYIIIISHMQMLASHRCCWYCSLDTQKDVLEKQTSSMPR